MLNSILLFGVAKLGFVHCRFFISSAINHILSCLAFSNCLLIEKYVFPSLMTFHFGLSQWLLMCVALSGR